MKNVKINQKFLTKIIASGLSLTLVAGGIGYTIGRVNSKNSNSKSNNINTEKTINKYLEEYTTKRLMLEQEIEKLTKQKELLENSQTFNINTLIVSELKFNNKSNLFILKSSIASDIYDEYHDEFLAWFDKEEATAPFPEYVHFDNGEPLVNYLTDDELEEIGKNGGKITTQELDKILKNIRNDYKEKLTKKKKINR